MSMMFFFVFPQLSRGAKREQGSSVTVGRFIQDRKVAAKSTGVRGGGGGGENVNVPCHTSVPSFILESN